MNFILINIFFSIIEVKKVLKCIGVNKVISVIKAERFEAMQMLILREKNTSCNLLNSNLEVFDEGSDCDVLIKYIELNEQ